MYLVVKTFKRTEKPPENIQKLLIKMVHPQNVRFKTSGFKTSGFKTSETSGLQNVSFSKRQVYKMSGLQNVRSSKRPVAKKHPYILCTCGWWKSAGSVAAMFAGKVMAVFYSLFRGVFLPYITIISNNDTLFTLIGMQTWQFLYFLFNKYIKLKNQTF